MAVPELDAKEIDQCFPIHPRLDPCARRQGNHPHVPVQGFSRKPGASLNRVALLAETAGSPSRMVQCLCQGGSDADDT